MVARRSLLTTLAISVALALAAPASASWASDARAVSNGLSRAVERGKLTRAEAHDYRRELRRTRTTLPRLYWTNAINLGAVLHDVAAQARRLNRPRALVLFSELRLNRRRLSGHGMPAAGVDLLDSQGVLYRAFPGQGIRFHPLGNFARLSWLVAHRRLSGARRLADSLAARGVRRAPRATVWEYTFPYGGGRPPWTSGMAQAAAAGNLARASHVLADRSLKALAGRAFRAVPGRLTLRLSTGPGSGSTASVASWS